MKAIFKEFLMEIRKSKARFLSILFIVALGVAFFSGIQASSPDMRLSGDAYFDEKSLMDLKIIGTMGLTEEDIEAIKKIEGVENVEGAYFTDVLCGKEAAKDVLHVESVNEQLNFLTVDEGELPKKSGEIFLDSAYAASRGYEIGDEIELKEEDSSFLKKTKYVVSGIGSSPLYISFSRGNTTLGSGEVTGFAYICAKDFDSEVFTQIYLRAAQSEEVTSYTEAYDTLIEKIQEKVEGIEARQCQIRKDSIKEEAYEELSKGEQELEDAKKEANEKLGEAKEEIEEGKKELEEGKKEYEDGRKQLVDARKELADGKKELEEAKQEIADGEKQLSEAKKQLEDGKSQLALAKAEVSAGWSELSSKEQELNEGLSALTEGKTQLSEGKKQLEAAKKELQKNQNEITEGFEQANAGLEEVTTKKNELIAQKTQCEEGLASVSEGEAQLEANKTAFEELKTGLQTAKEQLTAIQQQKAALEEQEKLEENSEILFQLQAQIEELGQQEVQLQGKIEELEAQVNQTEPVITQTEAQLSATRAELEGNLTLINSGLTEIEQKEREIAATLTELENAQTELNAGKEQLKKEEQNVAKQEALLKESEMQLTEGQNQLIAGKTQLEGAQAEIAANEQTLNSAQAEIAANEEKLTSGKQELLDGEKELSDGQKEITKNSRKLVDARREIKDAEKELKEGEAEYEEAKADAEKEIADAEKEIEDAKKEIEEIETPKWMISDRNSLSEYADYGDNAERIRSLGKVFPLIFFLVAALISLTTMTRMVEEQRTQIGTLKALGYGKGAIAAKYLGYAFLATAGGSVLGILIGEKLIPFIIIKAYGIMYINMSTNLVIDYEFKYAAIASGAAIVCTLGATIFSCYKVLMETPASLMRPPAPKEGKRVLFERIPFLWKHLNFTWKSTFRNLFRYKKRFFMTIFGIAGSMALLLVGFGLQDSIMDIGVRQYDVLHHYDGMVILEEEATDTEKEELIKEMEKNDKILRSSLVHMSSLTVPNGKTDLGVYIYVPENIQVFKEDITLQDRVTLETYELTDEGVVISEKTASMLGINPGDEITIEKDKTEYCVPVSAVTENYMSHYIYITPKLYEEVFGEKVEYTTAIFTMQPDEISSIEEVGNDILKNTTALSISYTSSIEEQLANMLKSLNMVIVVLIVSAGMLAFVVLYNLNNINITERQRELATLKVLGFYDGEVSQYVFRENILLTCFGVAAGIVFGIFLHQYVVTTVEVEAVMFGRSIKNISFLYSALLTVAFSMFVNMVMHFKLKKINMVESLKSVE